VTSTSRQHASSVAAGPADDGHSWAGLAKTYADALGGDPAAAARLALETAGSHGDGTMRALRALAAAPVTKSGKSRKARSGTAEATRGSSRPAPPAASAADRERFLRDLALAGHPLARQITESR
jgi:hypothetical protein